MRGRAGGEREREGQGEKDRKEERRCVEGSRNGLRMEGWKGADWEEGRGGREGAWGAGRWEREGGQGGRETIRSWHDGETYGRETRKELKYFV